MASTNPFDLLGDDDNDDPSLLLAAQQQKVAAVAAATKKSTPAAAGQGAKSAKFPTKPTPPTQAVKEARNEGGRGGGRGRGYGRGRGGAGGFNRDSDETTFGNGNGLPYKPSEDREAGRYNSERRPYSGARGGSRGGRRGGFNDGEGGEGERPRRTYDRHSGSGHGSEFKRDGAGRGNWGTPTDVIPQETDEPVAENEPNTAVEKQQNEEESPEVSKENALEAAEKEAEEKQMTLEEYEKVLEEKRKVLLNMKAEETQERKVDTKEFESMQVVSKKKDNNEIFIKLGSDKDKRKEAAEKEERAKKSVSINEFLKPAEGESYYRSGGRGRGRGRGGPRGGGYGGGGGRGYDAPAPSIADPGHFPSLGGK